MKILTNNGEKWKQKESLWDAFCLGKKLKERRDMGQRMAYVLAFVGGGGKTSSIYRLAAEGAKRGKKIIVMTTTHMLAPEKHCIFLENEQMDFEQVKMRLLEDGIIIVGDKINEKKMSFVGEEIFQKLLEMAELILVEADGSRHFPIKVPASHEPVIPSKIDEIVCVCGLSCYGKRASEVCFRLEQAKKIRERYEGNILGDEEWVIRRKDIMYLMREGFLRPFREREESVKISMMLTQADTEQLEKIGIDIFEFMGERGVLVRELPLVSEYRVLEDYDL